MKGMTKRERQVTDPQQILEILDKAKVMHLGLCENNEPYVVPMNYGYTMEDGKLVMCLISSVESSRLSTILLKP